VPHAPSISSSFNSTSERYSVRRARHENPEPCGSTHSSNLICPEIFLNVIFRRSWQNSCEKCLLASSCLAVRPTASMVPVSGFRKFLFGVFTELCRPNSCLLVIGQRQQALYMPCVRLCNWTSRWGQAVFSMRY